MVFPVRRCYTGPLRTGSLVLGARCLVMGILNVTPDSFAEASPKLDPDAAIAAGLQMEADGADIIDVGGESTRPGADAVSADEELARIRPVLRALGGRLRVPLSVDTYKAVVARVALDEGATIVNDISGLAHDPALADVVADAGAAIVLMHTRGRSKSMRDRATYDDLLGEVTAELRHSMDAATSAGISADRIIIDPGIGFAKLPGHSYGVLAGLPDLSASLGRPLLVGPSRKSFLSAALGPRPAAARDWGTAAAVAAAVLGGAHIVRVHAVAEMAQVVRVADNIRKYQPGGQPWA